MKQTKQTLVKLTQRLKQERRRRKGVLLPHPKLLFIAADDHDLAEQWLHGLPVENTIALPAYFEPVWEALRRGGDLRDWVRYLSLRGGRGSAKTTGMAILCAVLLIWHGRRIVNLRAVLNTLAESSRSAIIAAIHRYRWESEVEILENRIVAIGGRGRIIFRGMQKISRIKSLEDYDLAWLDEAQEVTGSNNAGVGNPFDILAPTIRGKSPGGHGAQIVTTHNPFNAGDLVEQFIGAESTIPEYDPTRPEANCKLTVQANYCDNPFFPFTTLAKDEARDREHRPHLWRWIWNGEFMGSAEGAIILPQWFDAAIDLHLHTTGDDDIAGLPIQVGFDPSGTDTEKSDPSAVAVLAGHTLMLLQEFKEIDVNAGARRVYQLARSLEAVSLRYDSIGVGLGSKGTLRECIEDDPDGGGSLHIAAVNVADPVEQPHRLYRDKMTFEKAFLNRKAQLIGLLADRFYNAYLVRHYYDRAIEAGHTRDEALDIVEMEMGDRLSHMIVVNTNSLDPKLLKKLRAECTAPIWKQNEGKQQVESKTDLKKRLGMPSHNLLDALYLAPSRTNFELWGYTDENR